MKTKTKTKLPEVKAPKIARLNGATQRAFMTRCLVDKLERERRLVRAVAGTGSPLTDQLSSQEMELIVLRRALERGHETIVRAMETLSAVVHKQENRKRELAAQVARLALSAASCEKGAL